MLQISEESQESAFLTGKRGKPELDCLIAVRSHFSARPRGSNFVLIRIQRTVSKLDS